MLLQETHQQLVTDPAQSPIRLFETQLNINRVRVKFSIDPKGSWKIRDGYQIDKERDPQQLKFWPEDEIVPYGNVFLVGSNTKKHGQRWAIVFIPFNGMMLEEQTDDRIRVSFTDPQERKRELTFVYAKSNREIRFLLAS